MKIKVFIKRISRLWMIAREYDKVVADLYFQMDAVQRRLGEHTTISADFHARRNQPHQIIVIGQYRRRDYVRVFNLLEPDFRTLIEKLIDMERYSKVGRFDMPHATPFKAVYDKDTFE